MHAIKQHIQSVTAFAPATVSNLAVGFDILGFPVDTIGDTITLTKRNDTKIIIDTIVSDDAITTDIKKNTATVALKSLCDTLNIEFGCNLHIEKGIPMSSGLGGSAASAVAALIAFNHFLEEPLSIDLLVKHALAGEAIASGQAHGDNVIPCLYGGLTLIQQLQPPSIVSLPIPDIHCVLVHPDIKIETRTARELLKPELPLTEFVQQSANLAGFIAALYINDHQLLSSSMQDVLIEPRRAQLIENFYPAQQVALDMGALSCSLSGSGPTIFAFAKDKSQADAIKNAMIQSFADCSINTDAWIATVSKSGAKVVRKN